MPLRSLASSTLFLEVRSSSAARWMTASTPLHSVDSSGRLVKSKRMISASGAHDGVVTAERLINLMFQRLVAAIAAVIRPPKFPNPPVRRTVGFICASKPSHRGCGCLQGQADLSLWGRAECRSSLLPELILFQCP